MDTIELWLVHPEQDACDAFHAKFHGLPDYRVCQTDYKGLEPHDCFVTAGNSYGIMTAGIDAAVVAFLGQGLMDKVQGRILDEYLGEQPVGTSFLVETDHEQRPFICHAPTMRTPGSIRDTDKIYTSTWSALLSVYRFNVDAEENEQKIRTVAMPAMGTGFGGVSFEECARQMAAAYHHFVNLPHRTPDWKWVTDRHQRICYDNGRQMC